MIFFYFHHKYIITNFVGNFLIRVGDLIRQMVIFRVRKFVVTSICAHGNLLAGGARDKV